MDVQTQLSVAFLGWGYCMCADCDLFAPIRHHNFKWSNFRIKNLRRVSIFSVIKQELSFVWGIHYLISWIGYSRSNWEKLYRVMYVLSNFTIRCLDSRHFTLNSVFSHQSECQFQLDVHPPKICHLFFYFHPFKLCKKHVQMHLPSVASGLWWTVVYSIYVFQSSDLCNSVPGSGYGRMLSRQGDLKSLVWGYCL